MYSRIQKVYTLIVTEGNQQEKVEGLTSAEFIKEKNRLVKDAKKRGFTLDPVTCQLEKNGIVFAVFGS